jgi:hypothetical protein
MTYNKWLVYVMFAMFQISFVKIDVDEEKARIFVLVRFSCRRSSSKPMTCRLQEYLICG